MIEIMVPMILGLVVGIFFITAHIGIMLSEIRDEIKCGKLEKK